MRVEAKEYGMRFNPKPPYEVLSTDKVSYFEMQRLKKVEEVVDKYYNSQKFKNILEFFYKKFDTPFEFFDKLGDYFEYKNYFNRNIGNAEYYKVFLDFNMEILKGEEDYLVDIIKYDYLTFNKKRGMPEYLKCNIDKEVEMRIKDELRYKYSFKDYMIEYFRIDMNAFESDKRIIEGDFYYLIGNEGEKIKV